MVTGWFATSDWIAQNRAAAASFAAVMGETARWANDPKNAAECAKMLATYTKVEPAVIAGYPRLAFAESNSPGLVQPVIDMLAHYTFIPHGFNAAELFAITGVRSLINGSQQKR